MPAISDEEVDVTAAVLVGGRSRRMGRDKSLLPWGAITLRQQGRLIGEGVASRVFVVGGRAEDAGNGIVWLPDRRPGQGPLAGLETALLAAETPWVLLLACDMPFVTPALLREMLLLRGDNQAVACQWEDRLYPLPGIYHRTLLGSVSDLLDRERRSLQQLLARVRLGLLELDDATNSAYRRCVININDIPEYERAVELARACAAAGGPGE